MSLGWIFFIILAIFCVISLLGKGEETSGEPYYTRARLTAKIDDMPNCWLCAFDKDGDTITAIYCDEDNLHVGDEITIVYQEGDEAVLPLVKKPKPEVSNGF